MLKFTQLLNDLRSSLWLIPSSVIILSIVLAVVMIELERYIDIDDLGDTWHMLAAGADGSRALLSTIANSMMAIASVTFSITILVLSQVSSQYSPRILRSFMRSHASQFSMGAFVGTFVYSIIVLRSISSDPNIKNVPSLAVLFGLLLAIISVAVLVFFIHHIASSIQASSVISTIANETIAVIDKVFPEKKRKTYNGADAPGEDPDFCVHSKKTGYLQNFDMNLLSKIAAENNCLFVVRKTIGEFVVKDSALLRVYNISEISDAAIASIQSAFAIGKYRTIEQDPAFGVRQLVDIALKALSPSLNDTTTAVMCLHHLGAIMSRIVTREIRDKSYYDKNGRLLLVSSGTSFPALVATAFDQIRLNSTGNLGVSETAVKTLHEIRSFATDEGRQKIIDRHIKLWTKQAQSCVSEPYDIEEVASFLAKHQ